MKHQCFWQQVNLLQTNFWKLTRNSLIVLTLMPNFAGGTILTAIPTAGFCWTCALQDISKFSFSFCRTPSTIDHKWREKSCFILQRVRTFLDYGPGQTERKGRSRNLLILRNRLRYLEIPRTSLPWSLESVGLSSEGCSSRGRWSGQLSRNGC